MYYAWLKKTVRDVGAFIPYGDDLYSHIDDTDSDWYVSLYQFNDKHLAQFMENHTVAGITDTTTDVLYFDFDSESNIELARQDALVLAERLVDSGVDQEAIQLYFTGKKGFSVELKIAQRLTAQEYKSLVFNLAGDLDTFDRKVVNPTRIVRVAGTRHQDTGLYKTRLSWETLADSTLDSIRKLSSWAPTPMAVEMTVLPEELLALKDQLVDLPSPKVEVGSLAELSFEAKPKFLSNCRWALQNGFFGQGERNNAFLCLAATYKNLGFSIEHVYRLLKGVAELQAKRNTADRFPDRELWDNICMQVFSPTWRNGQFSCRESGNWLQGYCDGLGHSSCRQDKKVLEEPHTLLDLTSSFKEYVKNIDKNTILTGIPSIDEHVFISTGANVGIIGAPGSGKSSIALNILNNTSKAGVKSVFASLDMARNRMYEKVMYKITGLPRDELYKIFQDDKEGEYLDKLKEEFGNVFFMSKSNPTVQDVRDYILQCQEASGEKIKLVMLDYFERVSSDISDDTAASKRVAGELQDLVNDLDIALITLVQPNKNALNGGPDQPIYDYTKIKGSSYVYQAFRIIMSLWRPFYNPKDFSNDKYMQMAVLKNDLGELNEFGFRWNGKRGEISELEDFEHDELAAMLKEKDAAKANDEGERW